MAVHAQGDQPKQDDFMLLADGNDINPTMVKRWRAELERCAARPRPGLRALARLRGDSRKGICGSGQSRRRGLGRAPEFGETN